MTIIMPHSNPLSLLWQTERHTDIQRHIAFPQSPSIINLKLHKYPHYNKNKEL
jgi:hypothetical protein